MLDVKLVLENLNSALSKLQNETTEVSKEREEIRVVKIKQDERIAVLNAKAEDLNTREGKVKEIESIVEFTEAARKEKQEAKDLMINAEKRQEILETGLKKLSSDRKALEEEYQDKDTALKNQAEALIEERKVFDDKVKAYKAVRAAIK